MKNALIVFKPKGEELDFHHLKENVNCFYLNGITFDCVEILPLDDDIGFSERFSFLSERVDNLTVLIPKEIAIDYKKVIATKLESDLLENENARRYVESYAESAQLNPDYSYAVLPTNSTLIPNLNGEFQGFMSEEEGFSLFVLSDDEKELKSMCDGFVIPYFATKKGANPLKFDFKYFGELDKLLNALEKIKGVQKSFFYNVEHKYGDSLVRIHFFDDVEQTEYDSVVRLIATELGENMYAVGSESLSKVLFNLLELRNVKISVAESFTGGRLSSEIVSNQGVSKYFNEGAVTYSNKAKSKRLGVSESDLRTVGAVSTRVAYSMCAGLLVGGDCDIAISTTGLAGPKSDESCQPVGLCFIGVGMKDGVHVYKYNFTGSREEITERAKNTALFLAIKKLKKI